MAMSSPTAIRAAGDDAPGRVRASEHEADLQAAGVRKRLGAYYTPPDVVAGILDLVLDPLLAQRSQAGLEALKDLRVLDPACGAGNFLVPVGLRVAAALARLGMSAEEARTWAFTKCVHGVDLDPVAGDLCRIALAEAGGCDPVDLHDSVVVADSLTKSWSGFNGFDLVVGNPPFLNQLAAATAVTGPARHRLVARFGDVVGSYTDPAAMFLLLACELAQRRRGRVAMIQPVSLLAARDAAGVRARLAQSMQLTDLWVAGERVFQASVEVCAPILAGEPQHPAQEVRLWRGRGFAAGPSCPAPSGGPWSSMLARMAGVPDVVLARDRDPDSGAGVLGDLAAPTADFRDQFYGLAEAVRECEGAHPAGHGVHRVVTVGLIDPAELAWGVRPTRIAGRAYLRPVVDLADLSPRMRQWAQRRLVPKVLVATQSRCLEAIVDETGVILPSVPVISVAVDPARAWHVAAVISAPPVLAWAMQRYLGAALVGDALKLSAQQLAGLPLPAHAAAWDEGAARFRAASQATDPVTRRRELIAGGRAMIAAYEVGDPGGALHHWWSQRIAVRTRRARVQAITGAN